MITNTKIIIFQSLYLISLISKTFTVNNNIIRLEIDEECKVGTTIGNLKTSFSLPENSLYKLLDLNAAQKLIQIDEKTGEIRSVSRIDREALCSKSPVCEISFNIEVKRGDTKQTELFPITLVVRDINDQRPKFESKDKPFRTTILESASRDYSFSLPVARDADSSPYDQTIYSIEFKNDAGEFFKLEKEDRGNRQVPTLRVVKQVDREKKTLYSMTLYAMDSRYPEDKDSTQIIVEVKDVNDNKPEWQISKTSLVLSECDRLHSQLLLLKATDKDEDKRIEFSIGTTASKLVSESFYVSGNYLKQNKSIDYELVKDDMMYIPLIAQDSRGLKAETEVEIRVTDCNDHYPNITVDPIQLTVTENDPSEVILARLLIIDKDKGENATVSCKVLAPYQKDFELFQYMTDNKHQTWYTLKKNSPYKIDRETTQNSQIHLFVECSDKGSEPKRTQKSITLTIKDENDNHPQFQSPVYSFTIKENVNEPAFIGIITAEDKDHKENAEIVFDLDIEGKKYFSLKRLNDVSATLFSKVKFDREEKSKYKFDIIATDKGVKEQLSAVVSVTVDIEDENDNPPVFSRSDYSFQIVENYGQNVSDIFIGQVIATDADIGINKEMIFEVHQNNYQKYQYNYRQQHILFYFKGDNLWGRGNFDREKHEVIYLDILAKNNKDKTIGMTGSASVSITLLDVNDNKPKIELESSDKSYSLDDAAAVGSSVLKVRGSDKDNGLNATLVFKFQGSDFGAFNIDPQMGIVTLIKSLKGSNKQTFALNIKATDCGIVPLTSDSVTVYVNLIPSDGGFGGSSGHVFPKTKSFPPENDHNLLILLCLAAVVFLIFAVLIGVLAYVHFRGRREPGELVVENPASWLDKANMELNEDATEITETGLYRFPDILKLSEDKHPYKSGTLVIDNTHRMVRSPAGTLLKNKSPSFGYIPVACNDRKLYAKHTSSLKNNEKYETYFNRSSDKLPRRNFRAPSQTSDPVEDSTCFHSNSSPETSPFRITDPSREYHNLRGRVEENRPAIDANGYAILTDTAGTPQSPRMTHSKAPYVTSSFV